MLFFREGLGEVFASFRVLSGRLVYDLCCICGILDILFDACCRFIGVAVGV